MNDRANPEFSLGEIETAISFLTETDIGRVMGNLAAIGAERDRVEELSEVHEAMARYVSNYDWWSSGPHADDEVSWSAVRMLRITDREALANDNLHAVLSKIALIHKIATECWFEDEMTEDVSEYLSVDEAEVLDELRAGVVAAGDFEEGMDEEAKELWVENNLNGVEDFDSLLNNKITSAVVDPHVEVLRSYLDDKEVTIPKAL